MCHGLEGSNVHLRNHDSRSAVLHHVDRRSAMEKLGPDGPEFFFFTYFSVRLDCKESVECVMLRPWSIVLHR